MEAGIGGRRGIQGSPEVDILGDHLEETPLTEVAEPAWIPIWNLSTLSQTLKVVEVSGLI